MSLHATPSLLPVELDSIASAQGRVVVFADIDTTLPPATRRADKLMRGSLSRAVASPAFAKLKPGESIRLAWPAGLEAEELQLIRMPRKPDTGALRKAGLSIGRAQGQAECLICLDRLPLAPVLLATLLRSYQYEEQKSEPKPGFGRFQVMLRNPEAAADALIDVMARVAAVHQTRDWVNAPANLLTTESFAAQIAGLAELGLAVEILDEPALTEAGLRALLAVGQGSESPSKLAILHWKGAKGAPLAIVGKGVMFDTGGVSLKPGAGMEEMTMDMGGAAVTVGVMALLARRKARANVVGVVGLVENMPDARAQRPGDVIHSMRGKTIEVINTDAEGRLVLADALWYTQQRFNPSAVIDLATLTGAIIVALGHEKAGVFANDDALAGDFLKAAENVGEGAWRMPLDPAYDTLITSRIADIKNSAGRPAGSVTAAQFLQHFIKDGTPWMHLDIAGVALTKGESAHAPAGASGWGVLALDALISARFEDG
jgi:leucyl aminopeptidase